MMGKRKIVNSVLLHVVLAVLAVIWITPIVWLIVTSFSGYDGMNTSRFFPETWSIRNYTRMLFEPDTVSEPEPEAGITYERRSIWQEHDL